MAKKTTVSKKTAKLDDKQLDKVQGGGSRKANMMKTSFFKLVQTEVAK